MKVVHCKREPFDVYVGRPSIWGNPFKVGVDASRGYCVTMYEDWINEQPVLKERARRELRGKTLGCWCKPEACHGDVLLRIANATL